MAGLFAMAPMEPPDLRGRFILGSGQGSGLTQRNPQQPTGGRETVSLGVNQLPRHSHTIIDPGHNHTWYSSKCCQGTDDRNYSVDFAAGDIAAWDFNKATDRVATGITIAEAGSGAAFDIMPPFYILVFLMKGFA